jgi:hypothetical protein
VLAAFGLTGPAVRLRGGQGTSWRVGDVVLKPGVDAEFQQWLGTELATVDQRGFRLPAVRRAVDGSWVVGGWGGQEALEGLEDVRGPDWSQLVDSARAFHAATAQLRRPGFLDRRSDPWAVADRAAWGESPRRVPALLADPVARLEAALAPLGPGQLVHGDLTGNVLSVPGEQPAVLDVSPYWRAPAYAEGIIVADALWWHAAAPQIHDQLQVPLPAVARGLLFRTLVLPAVGPRGLEESAGRLRRVLDGLGL